MKKITTYSFLLLLLATSTAMAGASFTKNKNGSARDANPNHVLTVPFYSEDFASGIPGTWQNVDNAASGVLWRNTTTGAMGGSFPFTDLLSNVGTTAANGYVIMDSDSAFGSQCDADLITDAIDCSVRTNVHLTLNSYFAQWANSEGTVSVSNDGGTTWNDVYTASAGLAPNTASPNPDAQDIDISSFAAGMTIQIKIHYLGASEYFWEVDDIGLYEVASADGGVTNISAPITSCSLLSATEQVTVDIKNFGTSDLVNPDVTFNDGTDHMENVSTTITPGSTYTYTFTATTDMSAGGSHCIYAYTTVPSDADPANDQFSVCVYSGPHVVDVATPYTQGFETLAGEDVSGWGSLDVDADANTWGLSTVLPRTGAQCADFSHELPTNGANDYFFSTCLGLSDANVYQLDFYYRNFSPAYQANMEVILCTDQDPATAIGTLVPTMLVNSSVWALSSSVVHVPNGASGNYYIGWHVTNQDSSTSLKIDDINLFYTGPDGLPSINTSSLALYPNPTNGLVRVSGIKEVTEITVYDMLGNAVLAQTANAGTQTLDLSKQSQGIYSVVMRSEKSVTTKQLVITGK